MKLTEHFSLEEFVFSETAGRLGIDNTPGPDVVEQLRGTAVFAEAIRRVLGVPMRITSGYRCLELNRALRSKDTSAHVAGCALDFVAPAFGPPIDICRAIASSDVPFDQLIHEHTWVHVARARAGIAPRGQVLTLLAGGGYAAGIHERRAA